MLVGIAIKISKKYTYKCVDRSKHNGIKGLRLNVYTSQICIYSYSSIASLLSVFYTCNGYVMVH